MDQSKNLINKDVEKIAQQLAREEWARLCDYMNIVEAQSAAIIKGSEKSNLDQPLAKLEETDTSTKDWELRTQRSQKDKSSQL